METFQISDNLRVVKDYFPYFESIEEVVSNMGLRIHTITVARGLREYHSGDDAVAEVISDAVNNFEPVSKALNTYWQGEVPYLITTLKGYSQGEWHEVVLWDNLGESTVEQLEGVAKYLNAIFAGEVYEVKVESAKVYTADDGDTLTKWIDNDDYLPIIWTEELFSLTAEWIQDNFGLEVMV